MQEFKVKAILFKKTTNNTFILIQDTIIANLEIKENK